MTQIRNDDMVNILNPDFVQRREPNLSWGQACSSVKGMPGLRGFWPMSSVAETVAGRAIDCSDQEHNLDDNNTVVFDYDANTPLVPYVQLVRANSEYLDLADAGAGDWADITGAETYIATAKRGLTLGGWWYFDSIPAGSVQAMISKWTGVAATSAYQVSLQAAALGIGRFIFAVRDAALTAGIVLSTGAFIAPSEWIFCAARYRASDDQLKIWWNDASGILLSNTATIVGFATIQDIGSAFTIGASSGGVAGSFLDGRVSYVFLSAMQEADATIFSLYHNTRAIFGV